MIEVLEALDGINNFFFGSNSAFPPFNSGVYVDIDDLPEHLLDEVGNFFEVYKLLEPNKDTTVKGWEGRTAAEKEISDAIARFAALPH